MNFLIKFHHAYLFGIQCLNTVRENTDQHFDVLKLHSTLICFLYPCDGINVRLCVNIDRDDMLKQVLNRVNTKLIMMYLKSIIGTLNKLNKSSTRDRGYLIRSLTLSS